MSQDSFSAHPFLPATTIAMYNPASGTLLGKQRSRRLLRGLEQRGYHTMNTEDGAAQVRTAIEEGAKAVIIIGGDGTMYELINAVPPHIPIAYFPGGTGNMFALNFNLPRQPEAWLHLLEVGTTGVIRFGLCNERPFASVGSVGFDAEVVASTQTQLKRILYNGAYALQFIPTYLTYDAPKFSVTIDGKPWEDDVLGIVVTRGPHYGGPFRILPNSDPYMPRLFYLILGGKSKWSIGKFASAMVLDVLSQMSEIYCGEADTITVDTAPSSYVQLDGDVFGSTPVTFSVEPHDRLILAGVPTNGKHSH
jgi:diacylglycerol kinase (ATP)